MARNGAVHAHINGKALLNGKTPHGVRRSDRFLNALAKSSQVTFISHVNPDPDSLGSMLALAHLVEEKLNLPTRLTRDGLISRAENKAMVELLDLELDPVEKIHWKPGDAVVMVDSQPNTGRHSIGPSAPLKAVIDHHETGGDLEGVPFTDVRPHFGATCTLVTKYLLEQSVDVPARVATALMYGIETEVSGYPREATACDDSAMQFLYPLADRDLLSQIRNARLPHSHFNCLLQALQSSFIYDRLILTWVDDLPQPEQAAEVCDFMVRFEQVDWAVCGGVWQDRLILSVRTSLHGAQAGEMLQKVVGRMGKAGGHDRRAGGAIRFKKTSEAAIEEVQSKLRKRFLKELDIEECRGRRLVPLREMLENLQS